MVMSPAYDLVCTRIHVNDRDMALKAGLSENDYPSFPALGYYAYDDFLDFGLELGLKEMRIRRMLDLMRTEQEKVHTMIAHSYLDEETKKHYTDLYKDKLNR
jgi:serine/threonine-protein kinase HipA